MITARRLALAILVLTVLMAGPASAQRRQSAARQLAETYSPVLSVEPQPKPCGTGEAYRPTTVDIVLGRRDVLLRDPHGKVVKRAPTSSDLWPLPEGYYIDLPGKPLKPGCGYESRFRNWNDGRPPSVYAHIAAQPSHPGRLAVQYWLYYTFNDFTDKHESDWEMAQVDFKASTPAEALRNGPYELDLSQHAGGERSDWTDTKVQKQGTHPVIYDATGSHANYFASALYLGRGAREGFGCDDTRKAAQRLQLQPVLLPDIPSSASAPYAWLAFPGALGSEGEGDQQRPDRAGGQDAMAHSDRVGRRPAHRERRVAERPGLRPERGQLLLRRRDPGRDHVELGADPPRALRGAPGSRLSGAAGLRGGHHVAASRSATGANAAPGRPDLPGHHPSLRRAPAHVRRGRSHIRSDLSPRRRDPMGAVPHHERRAADRAGRPAWCGDGRGPTSTSARRRTS